MSGTKLEENDLSLELDAPKPSGKKLFMLIGLFIVLAIGGVFGFRYWQYSSSHESTDDATLTTDVIMIAPQVSGTIAKIYVKDNQVVKAGDLLIQLGDASYQAAVEQAQANLDASIAQAKGAGVSVKLAEEAGKAQIQQAQGSLDQADSGIQGAKADVDRQTASIDNARAIAQGATANIEAAKAGLSAAQANRQRSDAAVKAAQAQVDAAQANQRAAEAAVKVAQTAADKAERDAKRYADLFSKGAVSAQIADNAESAAISADAQVDAASRQVDAMQAQVAARQADLASASDQVASADAAVAQAKAQLAAAEQQVGASNAGVNQAVAARKGVVQSVQQALARREQASGQYAQALTSHKQVELNKSAETQAIAKIQQAQAALDAATIQLRNTRIFAPCDGVISSKTAEMGVLVQPGTPLMSIVPSQALWVIANYKETQLAQIRPGEAAEIKVDAFPGHSFSGKVDSISAATGSTFALLPADNATGNFTKVVQRVPIKIVLDAGQPDLDRLQAGMSVTAAIRTQQQPGR